ncbi:hypothetical protein DL89DRAFT_268342 [Linderina pennispora]|uniref:Uncharacterized protein n=1 Tax=Linderina pennispora TaxID=61395 RepID=A0A1Y1W4T0_9FUNG|nr:uncharacterized protein DL89DRAFT_268342 [Linderina pennispora]ORX68517.1 hypothetical protein DL89DRAFT_268342 [Linderina pennispora]
MVESDHYRTLEQANPRANGPAISMVNALVGDPLQQQPQSRDVDFRRMSSNENWRGGPIDASHQMWNTGNAAGQFTAGSGHVGQFIDPNATTSGAPGGSHVMVSSPDNLATAPSANQDVEMGNALASSLTNKRPSSAMFNSASDAANSAAPQQQQQQQQQGRRTTSVKRKSSGRGRKSASSGSLNATAAAQSAQSNGKTGGTQQQLEQLQRLEELRSRVVLLQQLSSNSNSAHSAQLINAVSGPSNMNQTIDDASGTPSAAAVAAAMNAVNSGTIPASDVNGFLSSFAASIGTMASQLGSDNRSVENSHQQQQQQQQHSAVSEQWLSAALANQMSGLGCISHQTSGVQTSSVSATSAQQELSHMSSSELQTMISQLMTSPQHEATSTSVTQNATAYATTLQPAFRQQQQHLASAGTEMQLLPNGSSTTASKNDTHH